MSSSRWPDARRVRTLSHIGALDLYNWDLRSNYVLNLTHNRLNYNSPLCGNHRVEESNTRRLHIRKHAQGDPTTVRDFAKFRAISHLQLLMLLLEYAYPRTHRYPPWNYLRSPSAAPIFNNYLSSISFANLGRFELPFSTIRVLFWPLSTRECHPCFTTIGSDTFFLMAFNAYHIPSYLKMFISKILLNLYISLIYTFLIVYSKTHYSVSMNDNLGIKVGDFPLYYQYNHHSSDALQAVLSQLFRLPLPIHTFGICKSIWQKGIA